jgi:kynurenine formamidase
VTALGRRLIDRSTPVRTGHFRWEVERRLVKTHATGAGQATWAGWNVHAFTHMDSPRHVDPEGFTTDAITLDMTVGQGAVVDVSAVPANRPIERAVLAEAGAHLRRGDIALIRARWDERESLDTPGFWLNAPWMTADGAIWLRERGIKAVGSDFPQDHCIRFFLTGETRPPLPDAEPEQRHHVRRQRKLARDCGDVVAQRADIDRAEAERLDRDHGVLCRERGIDHRHDRHLDGAERLGVRALRIGHAFKPRQIGEPDQQQRRLDDVLLVGGDRGTPGLARRVLDRDHAPGLQVRGGGGGLRRGDRRLERTLRQRVGPVGARRAMVEQRLDHDVPAEPRFGWGGAVAGGEQGGVAPGAARARRRRDPAHRRDARS